MPAIRCFIAIQLAEEMRQELGRFQDVLRLSSSLPVTWVDPNAIHLTLKFLGDTPVERIDAIQQGLTKATADVAPFQMRLGRYGAFPNMVRPRVLWIGVEGATAQLSDLHLRVERQVSPLGFPTEERAFRPHLTLGRVRMERAAGLPDGQRVVVAQEVLPLRQRVDNVSLMKSQLTPGGAVHTRLGLFQFQAAELDGEQSHDNPVRY